MTTMTEFLEDIKIENGLRPYEDDDATEQTRAHIVNPPMNTHIWRPGMSAQQIVDFARAEQLPVVMLCETVLTPKRNPDKYPACEECMRIAGELMRAAGE